MLKLTKRSSYADVEAQHEKLGQVAVSAAAVYTTAAASVLRATGFADDDDQNGDARSDVELVAEATGKGFAMTGGAVLATQFVASMAKAAAQVATAAILGPTFKAIGAAGAVVALDRSADNTTHAEMATALRDSPYYVAAVVEVARETLFPARQREASSVGDDGVDKMAAQSPAPNGLRRVRRAVLRPATLVAASLSTAVGVTCYAGLGRAASIALARRFGPKICGAFVALALVRRLAAATSAAGRPLPSVTAEAA